MLNRRKRFCGPSGPERGAGSVALGETVGKVYTEY